MNNGRERQQSHGSQRLESDKLNDKGRRCLCTHFAIRIPQLCAGLGIASPNASSVDREVGFKTEVYVRARDQSSTPAIREPSIHLCRTFGVLANQRSNLVGLILVDTKGKWRSIVYHGEGWSRVPGKFEQRQGEK